MRHWFKNPVHIQLGSVRRSVTSVEEAGRLLLDWPTDCDKAKLACMDALQGGSVEGARLEFEVAAREAGILAD